LPFDPVEVQVDLPLVVAAEPHPEGDVVNLLGGDRRLDRLAGDCRLHPVEEGIHLVNLVSTSQRTPLEPPTVTCHRF
jgi:hypothetical protein